MLAKRFVKGGPWVLMHNECDPVETDRTFKTLTAAKQFAWQAYGVIPVTMFEPGVRPFSIDNPTHAAIAELESRHSPFLVVAVGPDAYYIRRNRFGMETQVRYVIHDGSVKARNDWEMISES